ncbi:hypothetical protein BC827DRAFT_3966 [Russula dissimulans]|nr:hypothetical protein BC827DRAFT_3966 [Russula dissimulans]
MANNTRDAVISELLLLIAVVLSDTFFFGVLTALFVFSTMFVLSRRSSGRARYAMLAVSMAMYAISAAYWALTIATYVELLTYDRLVVSPIRDFALAYLPKINYILNSGIVLWRAWVLWNQRPSLFIPPSIFLVCNIGISVASAVIYYQNSLKHSNSSSAETIIRCLQWSASGLTIGTNLWATCLIFIQAWQQRRILRSLYAKSSIRSKTEKTLAFFVESGALYLCIWIAYLSTSTSHSSGALLFRSPVIQLAVRPPHFLFARLSDRLLPLGFVPNGDRCHRHDAAKHQGHVDLSKHFCCGLFRHHIQDAVSKSTIPNH